MTTFSRIGLVSAFAFSGFVAAASSPGVNTYDIKSSVTSLQGSQTFSPKESAGKFLAIHYLPSAAGQAKAHADVVKDFAANSQRLAGLKEVFIVAEPATWTTNLGDAAALVFIDRGNGLAGELEITTLTSPATVVFDPAGQELFRWAGNGEHDHLSFAAFEQRFTKATAASALADYNLPKGSTLAIEGYDPVSYFAAGKAVKGNAAVVSTWRGVKYQFASKQNREIFNADPDKYAPTYGGWCASAMGAKGTKVEIDPTNFKIKDGRLHLFYKDFFSNALSDWNKHEKEWEPAADANWKKTSGEDPRPQTK
ncbi:MAG: YHS domain-containing protein [Phycisphaeraceae bacterium]|nr:YHS domain-containing protein [Phycisphaeraceae bacterium]